MINEMLKAAIAARVSFTRFALALAVFGAITIVTASIGQPISIGPIEGDDWFGIGFGMVVLGGILIAVSEVNFR